MVDLRRLSLDSADTVNNNPTLPQPTKPKSSPTTRRDSKNMAKSPEALTEMDLVAFDHVAAGQ